MSEREILVKQLNDLRFADEYGASESLPADYVEKLADFILKREALIFPPQNSVPIELVTVAGLTIPEILQMKAELEALRPWRQGPMGTGFAPPICIQHLEQMFLNFFVRPSGPPGNNWVCQSCIKERNNQ